MELLMWDPFLEYFWWSVFHDAYVLCESTADDLSLFCRIHE